MTDKPLIVALIGEPGVGRTTLAEALIAQGFLRVAFDDTARAEVAAAWRIDVRMLTDRHTASWSIPALAIGQCSETAFIRWGAASGDSFAEPRSPDWVLREWSAFRNRKVPGYFANIVERCLGRLKGSGWSRLVIDEVSGQPGADEMLQRIGAKVLRVHRNDLASVPEAPPSRSLSAIEAHGHVLNVGSLSGLIEAGYEAVEALA